MFFRKKEKTLLVSPREKTWQEFAKTLDLVPAEGSLGMIRMLLNEPIASISALYKTEVVVADQSKLRMFFLDYRYDYKQQEYKQQEYKHRSQVVSVCMLVLAEKAFMSLKASRKPHKVMEKLGASASGGEVIPFEDEAFSEAVTVYARDSAAAQKTLHSKAQEILRRALCERSIAPIFLMGEKVLLFSHAASLDSPTPLESLESLATDLLSLYAAFLVNSAE